MFMPGRRMNWLVSLVHLPLLRGKRRALDFVGPWLGKLLGGNISEHVDAHDEVESSVWGEK